LYGQNGTAEFQNGYFISTISSQGVIGTNEYSPDFKNGFSENEIYIPTADKNFTVTIAGPATASANYAITLPDQQGASGETIINDGSGNLSWGAATSSVTSVNGQTGDVTITYEDSIFNINSALLDGGNF
jgi:hypothetical protein